MAGYPEPDRGPGGGQHQGAGLRGAGRIHQGTRQREEPPQDRLLCQNLISRDISKQDFNTIIELKILKFRQREKIEVNHY